jgi:hypothetical protein
MSDKPAGEFIPNSFQVPNLYIDALYPLLDHEEQAMLIFACRRIFGWQKRTDRISASQFADGCDMNVNTVADRLKNLSEYKVFILVNENDQKENAGPEWALQLSSSAVDWDGLKVRKEEKARKNQARIQAARAKLQDKKVEDTPPVPQEPSCPTGDPPSCPTGTQNPIKSIKNICADAQDKTLEPAKPDEQAKSKSVAEPEKPAEQPQPKSTPEPKKRGDLMDGILHFAAVGADPQVALRARVSEYPADVQQTLLWLAEIFSWPIAAIPARPLRSNQGGKYAQWILELREMNEVITGHGKPALEAAAKVSENLSISHPAMLNWCLPAEVGKLSKKRASEKREFTPAVVDTPLTRALATFVPRQ